MSFITRTVIRSALAGLAGIVLASSVQAQNISGAGATFPYPVYAVGAMAYQQETGISINYQSIGSGGGIRRSRPGRSPSALRTVPLKPEDLEKAGLVQFPMIMGGVVPVVNVAGHQARPVARSTARRWRASIWARSRTGTIRRSRR